MMVGMAWFFRVSKYGLAMRATAFKGMFVRPEQIAEIGRRHTELGRLRLVVRREGEADVMTLKAETAATTGILLESVTATLQNVTKLGGTVDLVSLGSLPNDGKVIIDERQR
jgi:phenylacetate-CoA ligase